MRPDRIGLAVTVALHGLAGAALLSYEPARKALLAAAPIMVELILPPKAQPAVELQKPRPVARPAERPREPAPLIASPSEAPSAVVALSPPAPIEIVASPAPAAPLTQPIFNADYLDNPAPAYPALSRRLGEQGRVTLRVLVNVRGAADDVQLRTPSGFARLDDAARDTVRRWRFVPARRGAEPVPAWVLIPVSFRLEG
jgi:protein TonB